MQIFVCSKSECETVDYFQGPLEMHDIAIPQARYRLAFLTHMDEDEDNDAVSVARDLFQKHSIELVEVNLQTDAQVVIDKVNALFKRALAEQPSVFDLWKTPAEPEAPKKKPKKKCILL